MHYLITGHTGFKGSWLTLWLESQGHQVSGIALDPVQDSLFEQAHVSEVMTSDVRLDIRHNDALSEAVRTVSPDVVIHMAAQPLVRESYKDPRGTIETNVLGTLNVLQAVQACPSIQAHVVITTDKVYRNIGQEAGYVETDSLGGDDPYSASKAMADILTSSWVHSFEGPPTAIARAGNVIGGGDVSTDRLVPDVIEAFRQGAAVELRYPQAIRPWQHVLDCLDGYLRLTDQLLLDPDKAQGAWNFGPGRQGFRTVADLTETAAQFWGSHTTWEASGEEHPHEAAILALDATRAEQELSWRNRLDFAESVDWTVEWFRRVDAGENARHVTLEQISRYVMLDDAPSDSFTIV